MPVVKRCLPILLTLATAPAFAAGHYVVQCTAPCTASDGTTQPAGTNLNRIIAEPSFNPGAGLTMVPDTGQTLYGPISAPTTIASEDFINRFTAAEQQGIATAAQTNWQINLWLTKATAAKDINVSDPRTISGMQALVGVNLLTQARMNQILDLTKASP